MSISKEALERELLEMDAAFLNAVLNHDVSLVMTLQHEQDKP